jgi:hypothetical protein
LERKIKKRGDWEKFKEEAKVRIGLQGRRRRRRMRRRRRRRRRRRKRVISLTAFTSVSRLSVCLILQ